MSTPADPAGADVGLLCPVSAGTAAERETGDLAVAQALVRVEAALLAALVDVGIAPTGLDLGALSRFVPDPRVLALDAVAGGNPVIALVARLRGVLDERTAAWVHHGATSQDIVDTALMSVAADMARRVEHDLAGLAGQLAGLAAGTRAVPVIARTLTQQALPSTLGMWAAGWLAGVHDAVRQVRACTSPPVSLGGPVGTAAGYGAAGPAVVDAFAAKLHLSAPVSSWHTRRTAVLNIATAFTVATGACGKIAADILLMSQTEVAEAGSLRPGSSSSMAHKANPVLAVLVTSAARQVPALLSIIAGCLAAESERPAGAWHAEWQPLRTVLRLGGAAVERTSAMLTDTRFDHAAMRRNLELLVTAVGEGPDWVRQHTTAADVWIDRVLAEHELLLP